MSTGIRTIAATLNEKSVDPELVPIALGLGIHLFQEICHAKVASKVYDSYPTPYKGSSVSTSLEFIQKILGVEIGKKNIDSLLTSLEFKPKWSGNKLTVSVPSFRAHDIKIEEDIVEEIARIYGYHNLPSIIMNGSLPEPVFDVPFKFEDNLRQGIKALGGTEVLTYSLVSKEMTGENSLKLKNPLGSDTEYLRDKMQSSLILAAGENLGVSAPYHLFEIANVYLPRKSDLPEEKMMLSGVFVNYEYRDAKGALQALFETHSIKEKAELKIIKDKYYYEFEVEKLEQSIKPKTFVPIPKYPPQIEDITVNIPKSEKVGEVVQSIKQADKLVHSVELVDIYERNFTFRIEYLHPDKTLSDTEVERVREKIESVKM
jgi:phenylalanyl-tRNA synthetase beta chain